MLPLIERNISLKSCNTFGVDVMASCYASFDSSDQLPAILKAFHHECQADVQKNILILGGGSNMLFIDDYKGLVLQNNIQGISILEQDEQYVFVKVGGGVVWHDFVMYAVSHNFGGVENLSLIPGTVGASPIQNIGAYGVEVKDVISEVYVYDVKSEESSVFKNEDCAFGYRSSIFKTKFKNQFVITAVVFKLSKTNHKLQLDYGAIKAQLETNNIHHPTIKDVSNAIIQIRQSKLPDPKQIGNAGSFFKNPVVSSLKLESLRSQFPQIAFNEVNDGFKLAAGWLIEQTGWKGYRDGNVGVHQNQALVLVNYGNASGADILELAQRIQASVLEKFGVHLEMEVNIIRA